MSEIKMTNAIATILKGYGWNFYEHHKSRLSSGWSKYNEGGQLVAVMGDLSGTKTLKRRFMTRCQE